MQIVYKAVRKKNNKLYSGWVNYWLPKSKFSLEYGVHQITKAPDGSLGIFAFDSIESAINYIGYGSVDKILYKAVCDYSEPVKCRISFADSVDDYYSAGGSSTQSAPDGTVLCDSLMLLEVVKLEVYG